MVPSLHFFVRELSAGFWILGLPAIGDDPAAETRISRVGGDGFRCILSDMQDSLAAAVVTHFPHGSRSVYSMSSDHGDEGEGPDVGRSPATQRVGTPAAIDRSHAPDRRCRRPGTDR